MFAFLLFALGVDRILNSIFPERFPYIIGTRSRDVVGAVARSLFATLRDLEGLNFLFDGLVVGIVVAWSRPKPLVAL